MTKADDVAGTSQSNPLDVVSGTSFDSMKSADSYYDSDSTRKPSIESAPMVTFFAAFNIPSNNKIVIKSVINPGP